MLQNLRRLGYTLRYTVNPRKPLAFARLLKSYAKARLAPDKVVRGVDIVVGYECNLHCQHCNIVHMKQTDRPRLTMDDYRRLKHEFDELGVVSYTFTGGEPLANKQFMELLELFEPHRNVVILQTNGTLLTRPRLRELKRAGVDIIDVSIDSFDPAEHECSRGKSGSYHRVLEVLESARREGLQPVAETVASHANLLTEGFRQLIEYTRLRKFILLVNLAVPVGAWANRPDVQLTLEDQLYVRQLVRQHPHVRTDFESNFIRSGCPAVKEKLYITPYGDVMGCTFVQVGFGNVRERPIAEIRRDALKSPLLNRYFDRCPAAEQPAFIANVLNQVTASKAPPLHYRALI